MYNKLVMKSGEGREVESDGVILPTLVFDMCRGPGQQQSPNLTLPSVCSHPATLPSTVQSQQAVVYSATM